MVYQQGGHRAARAAKKQKREFNIVMSGQFRTLAMFLFFLFRIDTLQIGSQQAEYQ